MCCNLLEKTEFELLVPQHFPVLEPFFRDQPFSLSVFSLSSVFAWRDEGDFHTYFAVLGDVLLLMAQKNQNPTKRYMALPIPALGYPPERLAVLMADLGFDHLDYVPEGYIEHFGHDDVAAHFEIVRKPDLEDYIYRTQDLANLEGRRYSKKRNLVKQFERAYVETGRCTSQVIETATEEHVAFVEKWCEQNDCDEAEALLACDRSSAIDQLLHFDLYRLRGLTLRIDGKIAGLAVATRLKDDMGVLTVEKALPEYKGIYQYLDREAARRLFLGKYAYINKESDMGVPGLAQSKRSYDPLRREGCFKLTIRAAAKTSLDEKS